MFSHASGSAGIPGEMSPFSVLLCQDARVVCHHITGDLVSPQQHCPLGASSVCVISLLTRKGTESHLSCAFPAFHSRIKSLYQKLSSLLVRRPTGGVRHRLTRNILADKPRVTKFPIDWDPPADEVPTAGAEQAGTRIPCEALHSKFVPRMNLQASHGVAVVRMRLMFWSHLSILRALGEFMDWKRIGAHIPLGISGGRAQRKPARCLRSAALT